MLKPPVVRVTGDRLLELWLISLKVLALTGATKAIMFYLPT